MKLVIAMDSFKGTLSSTRAGDIVKGAFLDAFPSTHADVFTIADGGEGTVEALTQGLGGEYRTVEVMGPLGDPVQAKYGLCGGLAVIEMAEASGLTLVPSVELDPLKATTYGAGQLILDALDHGAKKILLGIGGSATNDGGAGMAQALGVSLLDADGSEINPGGGGLGKVERIDLSRMDSRVKGCEITVACDVKNPLCGRNGASHVYGPQKGATPDQVLALDNALSHFASVAQRACGMNYAQMEGAGAAGGLGFGLMAFCGAAIRPGIDVVLDLIGIDNKIKNASLVITGEGCMDAQSAHGKAPVGVAARARKHGVPAIAIVGQVAEGFEAVYGCSIDAIIPCVNRVMTFDEVRAQAEPLLYNAAYMTARLLKTGAVL